MQGLKHPGAKSYSGMDIGSLVSLQCQDPLVGVVNVYGVWLKNCIFSIFSSSSSLFCIYAGDRYLKPWIIPDPEVIFLPRAREDKCLVLASDGLWDVMSNEEACEIARRRILLWHKKNGGATQERGKEVDPAAQAAAEYLSMLALQKGSKDNISVIVVDLKARRKFKSKS